MASPTPAAALLTELGVRHELHEYSHDPAETYGDEAARLLSADPGRVRKTLVVTAAGSLAVAAIPVDRELDLKAMATVLEVKRATVVDATVADWPTVFVRGAARPRDRARPL